MAPLVVFPDAIAVWRTGLAPLLEELDYPDIRLAEDRPDPTADLDVFVVLARTGGPRGNLVADRAQLTADSYGPLAGERVAAAVRAATLALGDTVVGDVTIYRVVEAGGPAKLYDPTLEREFHRQTFTMLLRGMTPA